jgi:hypothetical protein
MFNPQQQIAKITNVNPRTEKHGDRNKLALDISLSLTTGNKILDGFDPTLRSMLFRAPESGDQQRLIADDNLSVLQLPHLGKIAWNEEFPGYKLEISTGADIADPLVQVVELSKFRFTALDGGSVTVDVTASCNPEPHLVGELCELMQDSSVVITLTPPAQEAPEAAVDPEPEPDPNQGQLEVGEGQDTLDAQEEVDRLAKLGQGRSESV